MSKLPSVINVFNPRRRNNVKYSHLIQEVKHNEQSRHTAVTMSANLHKEHSQKKLKIIYFSDQRCRGNVIKL
jgi:hypothetical protein